MTTYTNSSYRKIEYTSGRSEWGAWISTGYGRNAIAKPVAGDTVQITTKSGEVHTRTIARIVTDYKSGVLASLVPDEQVTANANARYAAKRAESNPHPSIITEQAAPALTSTPAKTDTNVRIFLSSRGWGDYSSCEWTGDITRPDAEILQECRHELESGYDVDMPNQTNEEILKAIHEARERWTAAQQHPAVSEPEHGTGYCYNCETYCYGDCGDFAPEPTLRTTVRKLKEAMREQD